MVKGSVSVQTKDHFVSLQKLLKDLSKKEVLVGIPQEESTREGSGDINNAELLYIHTHGVRKGEMRKEMQKNIDGGMKYSAAHSLYLQEHGSPLWQVPPRPVLEPAIEDKKEIIARQLSKVYKAALDGDPVRMEAALNKAGMIGEAAAKGWFENPKNGWPENSPQTAQRKILKGTSKLAKDLRRHYEDTGTLSDVTGLEGMTKPLIDTGQMRKAITYVVRDKS